jgi:amino acid permease
MSNADKEDEAPLLNPSDRWKPYTDSHFSERHLTPREKQFRTSGAFATIANLTKMYVGIAFVSGPKSISQTGVWCAIIGYVYIIAQTIFCIYLLLKARNRFKREEIRDIGDLGSKLYGDWIGPWL